MQSIWKIGLVEDQQTYREYVGEVFGKSNDNPDRSIPRVELSIWNNAEEFWRDPRGGDLDILLLDIGLPNMSGVDLTRLVIGRNNEARIVILSALAEERLIFEAMKAGALGYILKSEIPDLYNVARTIMEGGAIMTPTIAIRVMRSFQKQTDDRSAGLTTREIQTLETMAQGLSARRASDRLGISENTLNTHLKSIYRKLQVRNRVAMVRRAEELGLV